MIRDFADRVLESRLVGGRDFPDKLGIVASALTLHMNEVRDHVGGIASRFVVAATDDANIAGKNGGYTTYNFNLGYRLKNLSASLRVNNIFNQYYYFYTVYQTSMLSEFFYPAPGRNFTLNLKYTFD